MCHLDANWFVHEVNPMASDVGSARISAYNADSQEVLQGGSHSHTD